MKLAKHYQLRSRDRVCRYDITVSQCYALEAIVEHDGVPVTELARDLGLDKSTTSRVADSLVERRLATVEDSRGDARVRRLVATKAGRTLALRIKKEIRAEHRALFGKFSASDLAACDRVITALVAHTSSASCSETPTAA